MRGVIASVIAGALIWLAVISFGVLAYRAHVEREKARNIEYMKNHQVCVNTGIPEGQCNLIVPR